MSESYNHSLPHQGFFHSFNDPRQVLVAQLTLALPVQAQPVGASRQDAPPSIPTTLSLLLDIKRAQGVSQQWHDVLRQTLLRFTKNAPHAWSDLTPEHVAAHLQTVGGPRSRNNHLAAIHQLLSFARRRGFLSPGAPDPLAGFFRLRVPRPEARIYTPAALDQLLHASPQHAAPLLALVALSGVRMAEVTRLEPADIDLERKRILVRAQNAKTRARRFCHFCDSLEAWLRLANARTWALERRGLEWCYKEALRRAGVSCVPNGLRHSFISYRLALSQNEHTTALEAGTSPSLIFATYRDLVPPDRAQEWFSVTP